MKEGAQPLTLEKLKEGEVDQDLYSHVEVMHVLDDADYDDIGDLPDHRFAPDISFIKIYSNKYNLSIWVNHYHKTYYTINSKT